MHSNQVVRTEDGETWDETPWEVDVPPSCSDRILTYGTLLDVLWQMYHPWITYGTVRRIV